MTYNAVNWEKTCMTRINFILLWLYVLFLAFFLNHFVWKYSVHILFFHLFYFLNDHSTVQHNVLKSPAINLKRSLCDLSFTCISFTKMGFLVFVAQNVRMKAIWWVCSFLLHILWYVFDWSLLCYQLEWFHQLAP